MDVDYDEHDCPILPPFTDIIKSYAEDKARQLIFEFDANDNTYIDENIQSKFQLDHQPLFPLQGLGSPPTANPTTFQSKGLPTHPAADPHMFPLVLAPEGVPAGVSDGVPDGVSEGAMANNSAVIQNNDTSEGGSIATSTHPWQNFSTYKDGPAKIRNFPIDGQSYEFAFNTTIISAWEHPVPVVANRGPVATNHHPAQKLCKNFLAKCYLLQDTWFDDPTCVSALSDNLVLDSWDSKE
jgi:hypothetical protein